MLGVQVRRNDKNYKQTDSSAYKVKAVGSEVSKMTGSSKRKPLEKLNRQKSSKRDEIDEIIEVVARFASPGADMKILRASPFYRPVRDRVTILVGGCKRE
jgi:hypothetical protein